MLPKDLIETLIKDADNYAAGGTRSNTICLYPNENHIVLYTAHETSTVGPVLQTDNDDDGGGDSGEEVEDHWYSWAGPAPADVAEANHLLNEHLNEGGTVAAWTIDTIPDNHGLMNPLANIDYGLLPMSDDDNDDDGDGDD